VAMASDALVMRRSPARFQEWLCSAVVSARSLWRNCGAVRELPWGSVARVRSL
jgi:hypothetical protein